MNDNKDDKAATRPSFSMVEDDDGVLIDETPQPQGTTVEPESTMTSPASMVEEGETEHVPTVEFTEELFHADVQSIADSRTLASRIISAPKRQSETQGHHIAVEMAQGNPSRSMEDVRATLDAEKAADPAYQKAYRDSLKDGDFTNETLDWLGVTRWNMVKMGELAFDVGDWSDEEQLALVRLMAQYEELPISWETTKRAAEGLATDPTSVIGIGFVLNALAKLALKPAASAAVKALLKKSGSIALVTGVETGLYTATDDLFNQKIQVDTGNQEGYDLGQTATAGGIGFGLGVTIGGVLAAGPAKYAAHKAKKRQTPESFTEMLEQQSAKASDEVADEVDGVVDDVVEGAADDVADAADEVDEFADEFADEFQDDSNLLHDADAEDMPTVEADGHVDNEIVPDESPLSPTTQMPSNLRGAKPRYNYGIDSYGVKWESDVDKALYIIAGDGSRSHDEYMAFLRGVFPDKTDAQLASMGKKVKANLKQSAKTFDADLDGDLVVKQMFEPEKKPRRAKGQAKADDPTPTKYAENHPEEMPYNVTKMETSREVQGLVLERSAKYLEDSPRIPQTLDDVVEEGKVAARELAETTGGDFHAIVKLLKGDVNELRAINARIKATRDLHVWAFDEMVRLARAFESKGLDNAGVAELARVIEMVNKLVPLTMEQSAGQSRTLGSRRTMAISDNALITGKVDDVADEAVDERLVPDMNDNFIQMVNKGDGHLVVKAAVDQILTGLANKTLKSPRDLAKHMNPTWLASTIKEIQRVRAGSMLSGPTTLSMAFVSNFYNAWAEPALEWFAFTNLKVTKKQRARAAEDALQRTRALAQYTGNIVYMKYGLKQAWKALMTGKHITDPNVTRLENMEVDGWAGKSKKRVAYEFATGWSHVALLMLDEFHKATRGKSLAAADAIVHAKRLQMEAKAQGKKAFETGSPEWKKIVQRSIDSKFDEFGAITDDAIRRQVQMETYTEELVGPIGNVVNGVARYGHGAGGFVLPFRRAPLNSVSYAMQYLTPPIPEGWQKRYGFLAKQTEILKSGDKVAIAKLHARRKVGGMMLGLGWYMANDGDLTGGGPRDWSMRKAWIDAGNKPYSIKIAGTWIPYGKIEPFATIFGTVANLQYITAMDPERYQKGALEKLGALQLSMVEVQLNKAYFGELTNWMKMITGEDDMTVKMARSLITSFTPNVIRQMNSDPYLREANTAMEMIKSSVHSLSNEMGAKYDIMGKPRLRPNDGWWLFKQPKSHADTDETYAMVSRELLELRMLHDKSGLLGDVQKNLGIGRVDMQDVYDEGTEESVYAKYNRFIGETEINGIGLMEALAEAVRSDRYQERPKSVYLDVNSPHISYLSKIIGKYRKKAKRRLYDESPAFRAQYDDYQKRSFEVKNAR